MLESWLRILQELPLSKSEKELAARFAADPEGRGFLTIAEVLKTHQAHDECLELLTEGLGRHTDYNVARVVLARELYTRGLVQECLKTLEEAPKPLKDNLLAQKLRFKSFLYLNRSDAARGVVIQLKAAAHLDEETKDLIRSFETLGIGIVRDQLIKDFASKGLHLFDGIESPSDHVGEEPSDSQQPAVETRTTRPSSLSQSKENLVSAYFSAEDVLDDLQILGFQVMPLYEIFHPDQSSSIVSNATPHQLDSATLADIYTKQGHFSKALEVYKRLLRVTPGHDLIKRKIAELSRLEQAQKSQDLTIDPELVDRMEALTIIDKKVEFLEGLIQKIDHSR
jgi:tetratricopeptide (TPR) repeat protein